VLPSTERQAGSSARDGPVRRKARSLVRHAAAKRLAEINENRTLKQYPAQELREEMRRSPWASPVGPSFLRRAIGPLLDEVGSDAVAEGLPSQLLGRARSRLER
jgi:hypothetical protein